ncbi:MAG TPA: PilZ domain-containing protein [Candidatus Acidoferrales bacterium]
MQQLSKVENGQSAADAVEKRSCPRYPISTGAEAFDPLANIRIIGRLSDIARHGCYMDTISPFALNAAVLLTITRDARTFRTKAKVVYSLNAMGMGMMFTTTEPDQIRVLEAWLNELSGGTPLKPEPDPLPLDVPMPAAPAETAASTDQELRDIVRELIVLLNRKSLVGDAEAMAMMRKLSK